MFYNRNVKYAEAGRGGQLFFYEKKEKNTFPIKRKCIKRKKKSYLFEKKEKFLIEKETYK